MNRLHERCVRIVDNANHSSLTKLVVLDNYVSIHARNLQHLPTEMCKVTGEIFPNIF